MWEHGVSGVLKLPEEAEETVVATFSWEWMKRNAGTLWPLLVACVIILGFQAVNPTFLKYEGLVTLVYAMSYFLIAASGLTFVIMMGSFDFSVPSVLKLAALFCVMYIEKLGFWAIPFALLVSTGLGLLNGVLLAYLNVPSFMATLGVSIVVEGIGLYLSKGFLHIMYNERFRALATTFIFGLPSIFYWAMGIWALCTFVALCTPFGRRTYAIGGNLTAARLSGINVERQRVYVFALSGFLAGLSGVLYMAQLGGGSMLIGSDMSIPLFASVVAGGTALSGGMGGPHRTLLGVIIITWIQSGMLMLALGRDIQMVIFGLIAVGVAIATMDRKRIRVVK